MPEITINYWAVLLAGVANIIIGAIWYSKVLFAKVWMKEIGKKADDLKSGAGAAYAATAIASLVAAYVMAHFVGFTEANTLLLGAQTGFWAWLGFIAPAMLAEAVFAGKSTRLYLINVGYHLVSFVVMGMILAVWMK